MVWASEASFVSEPGAVFANQANQANQALSLRAKQVSRVSEPIGFSPTTNYDPPSPTGRDDDDDEDDDDPKSCFKIA